MLAASARSATKRRRKRATGPAGRSIKQTLKRFLRKGSHDLRIRQLVRRPSGHLHRPVHHGAGMAAAYGASELDKAVELRFNEIFEREVAVVLRRHGNGGQPLELCRRQPAGRCGDVPPRGACGWRTSAARRNSSPMAPAWRRWRRARSDRRGSSPPRACALSPRLHPRGPAHGGDDQPGE